MTIVADDRAHGSEAGGGTLGAGGTGAARFIVVEGTDGAGTTTMVEKIVARFRADRRAVHATCEPSPGPIGCLIRQALSRRLVVPGVFGAGAPQWTTMALLFAADRQDHLEAEILPLLQDGVSVICDRYDLSSLAYQSASAAVAGAPEGVVDWIRSLNRHARRPDITLVLDVDPEIAAHRRRIRGGQRELYEDNDLQQRICEAYKKSENLLPDDEIVHIDANCPIDAVLTDCLRALA